MVNIKKIAEDFKGNTKNTHVDYDEDLNARGSIDFQKGEVEVEVLIDG